MASDEENAISLRLGALTGSFDDVEALLQAGANANGCPGQPFPPIMAATFGNHVDIVNLFLEQGADPELPCEDLGATDTTTTGERALHVAAMRGYVEIVRLLLKRARANPNATDKAGSTPLVSASSSSLRDGVEVAMQLLLEAGADPTLAREDGVTALHGLAYSCNTDLVEMLYSRAPATLNQCDLVDRTPLFFACQIGHESMVSKLLSLGAMQPTICIPENESCTCPLKIAIRQGFEDVVRVLVNEGGIPAVGGDTAFLAALCTAVRFRRARILRLLLGADGEERRSEWANNDFGRCGQLLHSRSGRSCPAIVSVLLEAGADEVASDYQGHIPDDIGDIGPLVTPQMRPGEEVAVSRMLQRGPAYRARSWAWPSDVEDEASSAGGRGDGDTAAAVAARAHAAGAGAGAGAAVLSSPPAVTSPPTVGVVRIFRPQEKQSSEFFGSLIGRYCEKA